MSSTRQQGSIFIIFLGWKWKSSSFISSFLVKSAKIALTILNEVMVGILLRQLILKKLFSVLIIEYFLWYIKKLPVYFLLRMHIKCSDAFAYQWGRFYDFSLVVKQIHFCNIRLVVLFFSSILFRFSFFSLIDTVILQLYSFL